MGEEKVARRKRRIVQTIEDSGDLSSEERRQVRESTPSAGLIALLPDWIVPEEGKRHLWQARREALLAARSLVAAALRGGPMCRWRARSTRFDKGW